LDKNGASPDAIRDDQAVLRVLRLPPNSRAEHSTRLSDVSFFSSAKLDSSEN